MVAQAAAPAQAFGLVREMLGRMAQGRSTRRSRAEAAAETRRALLEAGAELLCEQPVGALLSQVTALEVARRARRTTGAFYHHWEDQESYQQELLAYTLDPERINSTARTADTVTAALQQRVPLEELVRRAARENFDVVSENPYVPLNLALWAKQAQDEKVRALLRDQYQAVRARLVPIYEALFEMIGVVPRPPFTVDMFAVTLNALVEGLVIRAAVDPDAVPRDLPPAEPGTEAWDLFSAVVLALVPVMTMPRVSGGDCTLKQEDIRVLVRELREAWQGRAEQEA